MERDLEASQGWICPVCKTVNAPSVAQCNCSSRQGKSRIEDVRERLTKAGLNPVASLLESKEKGMNVSNKENT